MTAEGGLAGALRALLHSQRVAALGTLDDDGAPFVSMVPFAVVPSLGCLALHVSGLAAHTGHLLRRPGVSLLVMQPEVAGEPVHALPRVTLAGEATMPVPDSPAWHACRAAYLERFPEAEPMTQLDDFRFVAIRLAHGRHIAGFGAARDVGPDALERALAGPVLRK
ncbi:heme utilization protein HutZ [Variovorax sp. SRS16]|uniref:HugZ family pyridoxamine 5'-phosphate oxidase n=1 Tax=Variovorax sp. SRS16 TaxID=282217 RepID=UPI0013168137|nr:pyridoxamine 5'-phosphate oxidase family protein [Variovorax sp. SRS16]VTU22848.1 heme utilization protein HutZ [Variovorax sp. SRS16]